jgi:hypothetical protein
MTYDINEIATAANQRRKPTKTNAFQSLRTLIDNPDESRQADAIADLYAFFMPPAPKVPKTPFEWLASACADKNDLRAYLRMVRSDGARAYATNGHILFIDNSDKRAAGYYDIAGNPIDDSATYPDIDRVIPERKSDDIVSAALLENDVVSIGGHGDAIHVRDGIHVNRVYLRQAIDYMAKQDAPIELTNQGPEKVIRLDCGDLCAVIMPIRV